MLGRIAEEYQEKGRLLLIGTTDLDARRPVMIDVEVDGQQYQEMHVDGSAMAQVFLYRPGLNLGEEAKARDAMTRSAAGNILSGCV